MRDRQTVILKQMKMSFRSLFAGILIVFSLALLFSCDVSQSMAVNQDLSGSISISGEAMDFAGIAFDDLAILGGFDDASGLYDDAIIQSRLEMAKREDISNFSLERTSPHGWSADAEFTDLRILLGSSETGGIVHFESEGGISTLTLNFDRETSVQYGKLVPLFENPAFSLFDPSQTAGLDEESYIQNILGFSFGPENIPEIRKAAVDLQLRLPGSVTRVTGGVKISDNSVSFEMPLTRMLVPDPPIIWSVSWR